MGAGEVCVIEAKLRIRRETARLATVMLATGLLGTVMLGTVMLGVGPAQGDAPSAGFKRITAPKGAAIAGLDGFAGYAIRLKGHGPGVRGLERFRHTIARTPGGGVRLVVLGPKSTLLPPKPRPKPELRAAALTPSLSSAGPALTPTLPGAGPVRIKPGMRPLRWPIDGAVFTSGFGLRRHPILGKLRRHDGVDLPAPARTPVRAAGDGVVRARGYNGGYGNYVRLDHGFGVHTAYGHLRRFARGLTAGRRVRRGDIIGYVGSTGLSTGPHLHYEVRVDGRAVDPLPFLPAAPRRVHVR